MKYRNRFYRNLDSIKDVEIIDEVEAALAEIESAADVSQISCIKKMLGHKHAYRIRISDYRIGIYVQNDVVEIACLEHRSVIYKNFP